MSLNHITSSATLNPWMNINCNDLKAQTMTSTGDTNLGGNVTLGSGSTSITTITGRLSAVNQPFLDRKSPALLSVADSTSVPVTGLDTNLKHLNNTITYDTGTGVFQVSVSGVYGISYSISWAAGTSGLRQASILKSGEQYALSSVTSSTITGQNGTANIYFNANDTFTLTVFQISGGALNLTGSRLSLVQIS